MSKVKKTWLALICSIMMLVAAPVHAIDWVTANQATILWDGVAYQIDPGERITYMVYLANAKTDPEKTNPSEIGTTQLLTHTITLAIKGSYYAGVKAMVEVMDVASNWEMVSESEVAWSDDPQYVQDGVVFGIRFYPAPPAPGGLRSG